ncbi:MAG: signal peptidase II [Myxococcota bacterium]
MTTSTRLLGMAAVMGGCIGCDQATKRAAEQSLAGSAPISFVGDVFRLQYAENTGAFLGMGGNLDPRLRFWAFTILVAVLLLGALWWGLTAPLSRTRVLALAAILGGGWSNWLDRVVNNGAVVDFMNLGLGPLRTGIFNVADVAIVVGAALLAVRWSSPQGRPAAQSP